jgi:putative ABC transport system permease protein
MGKYLARGNTRMLISDILSYAVNAIRRKKTRKVLAILGVAIGIAAIVSLVSLSQGFQESVKTQFQKGFAADTVIVTTQSTDFLETESDFELYLNDTALINQIENVKNSVALMQKTCFIRIDGRETSVVVVGVNFEEFAKIYPNTFRAKEGTIQNPPDSHDVVIGIRISDPWKNGTVFGEIGEQIEITWTTRSGFQVENKTLSANLTAILEDVGSASIGGPTDNGVYVPIETAQNFFNTTEVPTIIVQLTESTEDIVDETSKNIQEVFGGRIQVVTPRAVLNAISSIVSTIELFLTGISAISLLVAGVGIMNIMLTSLLERTREIGILKALGMFRRTVLAIFLDEALIIGIIGSAVGILLGVALATAIDQFGLVSGLASGTQSTLIGEVRIVPVFSPFLLGWASFFGVTVSIVFGLYPAWRASRLNPVDALRHE